MPWSYYWTSDDIWERRPARWAEDTRLAPQWTFHSEERVIALAVPSGKPAVSPLVRDVPLCSSDSPCLLRWVEDALKVNSSAIWQDWRIESYFWTLWSRCITYNAEVDLSYVRDAVRSSSHGTAVDFIRPLSEIYSGPHQLAPSQLSSALDNKDLRGIQIYGPLCLDLLPRVAECYNRYLEWIHRELVFRALGLDNDPGVGDAVALYAKLDGWWERLQDGTDRLLEEGYVESVPDPSSTEWPSLPVNQYENVSPTPLPQVNRIEVDNVAPSRPTPAPYVRSEVHSEHNQGLTSSPSTRRTPAVNSFLQDDAGLRNDPPTPSLRRMRTRSRVVVSEENPHVSPGRVPRVEDDFAPQLSSFLRRERPSSRTPTANRPSPGRSAALLLNAEVFYAADCLHAVNVLTRLYEGHLLPVDANDPYLPAAIKVITAQGSDADLTLLAWQRDLRIRRQLRANPHVRDLVYPAMGIVYGSGGYPDFVSPWSYQGSLANYMAQRAGDGGIHREEVLDLIVELLRVVLSLHEMGIVHGNLKGSNFLVTENGEIQLCDFGAYRTEKESQSVPSSIIHDEHEVMMHKSGFYMSPELRHSARPSLHSDMWAVSCVCLELFSAVYGDSTALESVALQCHSQLWPVRPKYIAKPVWDVLAANWRLEPSQRLSASEMHSRLTSIRVGMGVRWQ